VKILKENNKIALEDKFIHATSK